MSNQSGTCRGEQLHVLFPGDRPIGIDDQLAAEDFALRRRDDREDDGDAGNRRRNELGRAMAHSNSCLLLYIFRVPGNKL